MAKGTVIPGLNGGQVRTIINNNDSELYAFKDSTFIDGINVLNYGAVGDGETDNLTAFTQAFAAAVEANQNIIIPSGTYLLSNNINVDISNSTIKIIGSGKCIIKSTAKTVTIGGIVSENDDLSEDIAKGDDFIYASSLHLTVVHGNLLQIVSTDEYANVGVSSHYKGEIVEVLRAEGTKIWLKSKCHDSYNKLTTHVRNMNAGSLKIYNVDFNNTTLTLQNLKNSVLRDFNVINGNVAGIQIFYSKNVLCDNLMVERSGVTLAGWLYGILTAGSQNVRVNGCEVKNYSQGIIAGGMYPTRDYVVSYNRIQNDNTANTAQIDTHEDVENIQIVGNTLINGTIYAKGVNINISGNVVNGKIEAYREDITNDLVHVLHQTQYINIDGNTCSTIWVGIASWRDTIDYVNVSRNIVNSTGYAFLFYADHDLDCFIKNFNVSDNYLSTTTNTESYAVYFSGSLTVIDSLSFVNNIVKSTDYHPFFITNASTFNHVDIDNNKFFCTGSQKRVYVHGVSKCKITNNILNGTPLDIVNTHAYISHNIFRGFNPSDSGIIQGVTTDEANSIRCCDNVYEEIINRPIYINHPNTAEINEVRYLSGSLTDNTPTAAEINAICGSTAVLLGKGYRLIIKDTSGSGLTYECVSDGTNWCYKILTIAN